MQPRNTVILLVLAAALGAFVYFYEIGGEESRRDADARASRLFADLAEADIQVITLSPRLGEALRLERDARGWWIREPLDFPADRAQADGLAAKLASLSSPGPFEDPAPLAEYGLDEGSALRVAFEAGDRRHQLAVGDEAPVGGRRYLAAEGGIHSLPSSDLSIFEKSLDDLRDRKILDFDAASIQRLELGWPGGGVLLQRSPDAEGEAASGWRIVSPIEARADAGAVEDLLSDLSFLRAEAFVDAPSDADLAGFAVPALRLTLGAGESLPPLSLVVGGVDAEGRRLLRVTGPGLYGISDARFDELPRELFAYRHKQLADFPPYEADQLELYFQQPGSDPVVITARRESGSWSASPEPIDPKRITALLSEFSHLQASGIAAESVGEKELEALGLSPPRAILSAFSEQPPEGGSAGEGERVEGADEEGAGTATPLVKLAELRLGVLDAETGLVAQVRGDPVVYRIPLEAADALPTSLEAFRARFAAAPPELEEVPLVADPATDFLPSADESP